MTFSRQNSSIDRHALYFGEPDASLFGVFHIDLQARPRHCVVVICSAMGFEYIHGHRSVRHLADEFARHGIPALRFDYHGTGDSPGSDLDADRLQRWLKDIRAAIKEASVRCGGAPVCLLGIRLGAALASLVSAEDDVRWLALWFPVASGRRYVREQKMVAGANSTSTQPSDPGDPLEVAGFLLTQETQASLGTVNLLSSPSRASGGVLLIQREELGDDRALVEHFAAQGLSVDSIACPGYADMVAEPVDTVVPHVAIDSTVAWLEDHTQFVDQYASESVYPGEMRYEFLAPDGQSSKLIDMACRFGNADKLFGIFTRKATGQDNLPAVVLLNSGAVHGVGSNRVNVLLARNLAVLGFPVFRFDFEGIGESVSNQLDIENNPYPDSAERDIDAALGHLSTHFGLKQFVVAGLCSGAYHAFVAAVNTMNRPVVEVLMMNPPNLNWKQEGFLFGEFGQVVQYRESVRSNDKWMKLLKGQVNILNVIKIAYYYVTKLVKQHLRSLLELVYPASGGLVANQLRKLYGINRHVSVVCSVGDPSWDILLHNARLVVGQGIKHGKLTSEFVLNADHTFSNHASRVDLVAKIRDHLISRYCRDKTNS